MNVADKNTRLTRITGRLIADIHALAEWGAETGNLSRDQLEMEVVKRTPRLRKEAAQKLIEGGMSQRNADPCMRCNFVSAISSASTPAPVAALRLSGRE